MKKIIIAAGAVLVSTAAFAQFNNYGTGSNSNSHYVQPHTRSNGSYVGGHYQTNPDSSTSNNYGTPGNFNSHTGKYKGF